MYVWRLRAIANKLTLLWHNSGNIQLKASQSDPCSQKLPLHHLKKSQNSHKSPKWKNHTFQSKFEALLQPWRFPVLERKLKTSAPSPKKSTECTSTKERKSDPFCMKSKPKVRRWKIWGKYQSCHKQFQCPLWTFQPYFLVAWTFSPTSPSKQIYQIYLILLYEFFLRFWEKKILKNCIHNDEVNQCEHSQRGSRETEKQNGMLRGGGKLISSS